MIVAPIQTCLYVVICTPTPAAPTLDAIVLLGLLVILAIILSFMLMNCVRIEIEASKAYSYISSRYFIVRQLLLEWLLRFLDNPVVKMDEWQYFAVIWS